MFLKMDDLREAVEEKSDISCFMSIVIKKQRIMRVPGRLADPSAESVSENKDCLS